MNLNEKAETGTSASPSNRREPDEEFSVAPRFGVRSKAELGPPAPNCFKIPVQAFASPTIRSHLIGFLAD